MRYTMKEDRIIADCVTPERKFYEGLHNAVQRLVEGGFNRNLQSVKRRFLRLAGCFYEKPRQKRGKPERKEESRIAELEQRIAALENMLALIPYYIYQLPADHPDKFCNLPDDISEVRMRDYMLVYIGELRRRSGRSDASDIAVLEELFYRFNVERPEDFLGHSLSVSDVVQVGDRFYRCESVGWKQVSVVKE
jgi:hypothetical protein